MKYRGTKIAVAMIAAIAVVGAAGPAEAKKKRTKVSLEARSALFYGSRNSGGTGTSDFGDTLRSGYQAGLGLSVDQDAGPGKISFDASSDRYNYFSSKYRDRWSNRVALGYGLDVAPGLNLSARGAYATQLLGLEFDRFNQSELRSMWAYTTGPSRFRLGGGYRWRKYDDLLSTHGRGAFIDADYRYKLNDNSSVMLDFGYDQINADIGSRDYRRFSIAPSYTFMAGPSTEVTLSSRWRTWTYDNRYVGFDHRRDSSIQPMVEVSQRIGKDWYVDAGAGYRWRWSNQPGGDERGPRLQIGLHKSFGLN